MTWTPAELVEHRWNPQDAAEHALVIVDQNIVLPSVTDKAQAYLDLSQNVTFGRPPYSFWFIAHNFPAGTILEPGGLLFFLSDAMLVPGAQYAATIGVRDANDQQAQFSVRTTFAGLGPLIIGGSPPAAHTGVPFYWRPVISGGIPPYRTRVSGLNFPELGFKVSDTTGEVVGTYNGSIGNSPGNLFAIRVWNRSLEPDGYPSSGFDAELVTTWDLLDP